MGLRKYLVVGLDLDGSVANGFKVSISNLALPSGGLDVLPNFFQIFDGVVVKDELAHADLDS